MPISLSAKFNIDPKKIRLTALLLLLPLFFFAQSLTGLWIGTLTNDSSSTRKDQSFEIALTEYRGKVYGYSRSEFIVNDTLYYIVKRVKGTIAGDTCEVKDDEILSYNFPTRLDKGIKIISTFYKDKKDSTWYLAGKWKTNQTKKYYSITGKVDLKEEKDLNASKIFPHLQELNLADDVAFYKERKKETKPVAVKTIEPDNKYQTLAESNNTTLTNARVDRSKDPENQKDSVKTKQSIGTSNVSNQKNKDVKAIEQKKPETIIETAKTDITGIKTEQNKEPENQTTNSRTDVRVKDIVASSTNSNLKVNDAKNTQQNKPEAIVKTDTSYLTVTKPQEKEQSKNQKTLIAANDKENVAVVTKSITQKKVSATSILNETKKTATDNNAAAFISGRKSEFSQVVNFKSDSLELALYDNGEVDGDTVSILLNGEVILAKQGLKASAIKKTIYIDSKDQQFNLVLYAENLGKYPPNTGLLVVHDGDDVYNVRFTADFQTNAAIIFRRKQKQ